MTEKTRSLQVSFTLVPNDCRFLAKNEVEKASQVDVLNASSQCVCACPGHCPRNAASQCVFACTFGFAMRLRRLIRFRIWLRNASNRFRNASSPPIFASQGDFAQCGFAMRLRLLIRFADWAL